MVADRDLLRLLEEQRIESSTGERDPLSVKRCLCSSCTYLCETETAEKSLRKWIGSGAVQGECETETELEELTSTLSTCCTLLARPVTSLKRD